jgi:hypothetical protein
MTGYLCFPRPLLSEKGFVGLAPDILKAEDITSVLLCRKLSYILRENVDRTFRLEGGVYVYGIMYGEPWQLEEFHQKTRHSMR